MYIINPIEHNFIVPDNRDVRTCTCILNNYSYSVLDILWL